MGSMEIKSRIWDATTANDPKALKNIFQKYPALINDPISEDKKTNTVSRAAYLNRPHIIAILATMGADLNRAGESGITALMWAAARGHIDCLQILLKFGADLEKTGPFGLSALDFAILHGNYASAFYLFSLGVVTNKTAAEFEKIKQEFKLPTVYYGEMLKSLDEGIRPENAKNFMLRQGFRGREMQESFRDPLETWENIAGRTGEVERPALIEVEQLSGRNKNRAEERKEQNIRGIENRVLVEVRQNGDLEEITLS
jgi:hypothetical protein